MMTPEQFTDSFFDWFRMIKSIHPISNESFEKIIKTLNE